MFLGVLNGNMVITHQVGIKEVTNPGKEEAGADGLRGRSRSPFSKVGVSIDFKNWPQRSLLSKEP